MEHARHPAQRSQLTVCGFSRHFGQWTQSMQNGRCVLVTLEALGILLAALPDAEHALDERVWMGSKTSVFMSAGVSEHTHRTEPKNALLADLPIRNFFSPALHIACSCAKSCMPVNAGMKEQPALLKWSGGVYTLLGPCFIGRRSDNDIPISNVQASRRHAVLMNLNDDWWINDLGSRNGVIVNGLRINCARRLKNGDEIRIANQRLIFSNSSQPAPHHSSIMGKTTELAPQTMSDAPLSSAACELLIVTEQGEILEGDKAAHWFFGKSLERAPGAPHYFLPPTVRQWLQQLAEENENIFPPLEMEQEGHRIVLSLARCRDNRFYLLGRVESLQVSIERLQSLGLTEREAEVMHWVCEGKNNPEIAQILDVTLHTVNRHNEHIFKKLAVDNRHKAIKTVKERLGV